VIFLWGLVYRNHRFGVIDPRTVSAVRQVVNGFGPMVRWHVVDFLPTFAVIHPSAVCSFVMLYNFFVCRCIFVWCYNKTLSSGYVQLLVVSIANYSPPFHRYRYVTEIRHMASVHKKLYNYRHTYSVFFSGGQRHR